MPKPSKDKKASSSSSSKVVAAPPSLTRPLPPTHIQKVGTLLELEVVADAEKEAKEHKDTVSKGGRF